MVPPPARSVIPRPDLLEQLSDLLHPGIKLGLVSAPAGYGKTTLACEWIQSARLKMPTCKFAWLSLDEQDNEPVQFFSCLIAAIRAVCPDFGETSQALVDSSQPFSPQAAARAMLRDLIALNTALVVILDDYQMIRSSAIHTGLAEWMEYLPPEVHLLLTTRSDPALPLHRYRARGQMVEIRQGDLRFTREQMAEFMQARIHLDLPEEDLAVLEEHTEGWPAGLLMTALSLRGRGDARAVIRSLSTGQRNILDYLTEEVLRGQTSQVQRFLFATSLVDRFSPDLAAALLPDVSPADIHEILRYLEDSNLFLVPLDAAGEWFRYHHLFTDLLRARHKMDAGERAEIHTRAGDWFKRQNDISQAIQQYLLAGKYPDAADLVEAHTVRLFAEGRLQDVLVWIRKLPEDLVLRRPWLCIQRAWALSFAGQIADAAGLLKQTETSLPEADIAEDERQTLDYEIRAIRSMLAITSGDIPATLRITEHTDPPADGGSWFAHSVLLWSRGYALRMLARVEPAAVLFRQVLDIGRQRGNAWTILTGTVDYGNSLRLCGRLQEAEEVFRSGLEKVRQTRQGQGFIGRLESFLAAVLYEQNRIEEAFSLARAGVDHNRSWENPNHLVYGYWVLARIYYGIGNTAQADEVLKTAEELLQQVIVVPNLLAGVQSTRVRIWLKQGNIGLARQFVAAYPAAPARLDETGYQLTVTAARVSLAEGDALGAYRLLEELLAGIRGTALVTFEVEAETQAALSAAGSARALEHLAKAITLGLPRGFCRCFVDEGLALAVLLDDLLSKGSGELMPPGLLPAVKALRAEFPVRVEESTAAALTQREVEIIRWMAAGLSNQEIGRKLFISAGTVKAHSASIYRKLDAANRAEAVSRAKDLHLLDPAS
jgi:LuxR family maltose regulon positive regulatory protein